MFRNKIPEPCWIPEEPHQGVWNRTIGAGCGCERGFTSRRVAAASRRASPLAEYIDRVRKRFILLLITKTLATAVLSLGLGGRRAAKLAWHRLANANLRRRDGHAPRRHRIVAGDGVKVMRLLLPAIVDRVQRLSREYLEIRNRQMHAKAFMAETSAAAARGELIAKDLVAAQAASIHQTLFQSRHKWCPTRPC